MKAICLSLTSGLFSNNTREPGLAGCYGNLRIAKASGHYRQVFPGHVASLRIGSLQSRPRSGGEKRATTAPAIERGDANCAVFS
jgi:hypothetical protein